MQDQNKDYIKDWYRSYEPQDQASVPPQEDKDTAFSPRTPAEPPFSSPSSLYPSAGVSPYIDEAPKRRRKPGTALKAALIVLSVVILIIATAVAFMNPTDGLFGLGTTVVPTPQLPAETPAAGDMPDDYQDYFSGYFVEPEQTVAGNTIPTIEADDGVQFQVRPVRSQTYTLQEIYTLCSESIVSITAYTDDGSYFWGTGIIFSSDGYVVTNAHVLDGTSSVVVTLADDMQYEARLVGSDVQSDIAVLRINAGGLPAGEFGDSDSLQVGDDVVAIGNPLGEDLRGTMTNGIVSAINRDITYNGNTMTLIQTNAALNQGNSGGALINMHGQIVGITNMKMMSSYSSIEGIGFAIPSVSIKAVVDQLLDKGYVTGRPTIGITVGEMPEYAASYYELPGRLIIESVQEMSDAWQKGVRSGDVIVSVEGKKVTTTAELRDVRDTITIGDTMHFVIYREGELLEFEIILMDANELEN